MRRNLTLSIEDDILHRARVTAAKRKTTLTALIRDFLTRLSREERERDAATRRLRKLMAARPVEVGPITWKRDGLYER